MSAFCKECGASVPIGSKKCPECGEPVPAPAVSAASVASRPVSAAAPSGAGSAPAGRKIIASSVSENNATDNSQHVNTTSTDNSSHVHNTTIIQGGAGTDYCGVCGSVLEKNHAKCPKCGKKICPSCKADGKSRCIDCDKKAKEEYRLEFRGMLLEMGGKLNAFGRRMMDETARKLDITAEEKAEIEKEFASYAQGAAASFSDGVKTASAPDVAQPAFSASPRVTAATGTAGTIGGKGLGAIWDVVDPVKPVSVAQAPQKPSASAGGPTSSASAGTADNSSAPQNPSAGTSRDSWFSLCGVSRKFFALAVLGTVIAITIAVLKIKCPPDPDIVVRPAGKYLSDYTAFEDKKVAPWAREHMPKKYGALEESEKNVRNLVTKIEEIRGSGMEVGYFTEKERSETQSALDETDISARAIRDEILGAYWRFPKRILVTDETTFRSPAGTDYTRFERDGDKIVAWAKRKMPADFDALANAENAARAADENMVRLAKPLESDPATWGNLDGNADFVAEKTKLEKAENSAKSLHEKILNAYAGRPKTKPYALERGDTPTKICAKHGITMDELRDLNPGVEFSVLKMSVGQVIAVPATAED